MLNLMLKCVQGNTEKLTAVGLWPHFPLPADFAASSTSTRCATSGDDRAPSLRTVTKPSETKDSVMFSAEAKSRTK